MRSAHATQCTQRTQTCRRVCLSVQRRARMMGVVTRAHAVSSPRSALCACLCQPCRLCQPTMCSRSGHARVAPADARSAGGSGRSGSRSELARAVGCVLQVQAVRPCWRVCPTWMHPHLPKVAELVVLASGNRAAAIEYPPRAAELVPSRSRRHASPVSQYQRPTRACQPEARCV